MAFVVRQQGPIVVERGVADTLTLNVQSSAGVQQTLSSVTLGIFDGSDEVVAQGTTATTEGPPSTFTLTTALTTDRSLSHQLLAIWEATINGRVEHFRQVIHLVRHRFHSVITDTDLYAMFSELEELLPSGVTSWEKWRERARQKIDRDMLKMQTRPELIFDAYQLLDAHVALSLYYIFRDFDSHLDGPSKYGTLSIDMIKLYNKEMVDFRTSYDANQTGTVDSSDEEAAGTTQIVLTAGPIR